MDPTQIIRHETLEERGNRDAFHALLIVSALFALFLVVLGIAAWNSRFMLMPLVPKEVPHGSILPAGATALGIFTARPFPRPMLAPTCDAIALKRDQSSRPATIFPRVAMIARAHRGNQAPGRLGVAGRAIALAILYHPMNKSAARSAQNGSRMAVSLDHQHAS